MNTIRLFESVPFPLVPIACRDCSGPEDCDTCANEGEVLVDEVLECDEVRDDAAFEVHFAFRTAYFAQKAKADEERAPWPPRQLSRADHAEIGELQSAYAAALSGLRAPGVAA